MPPPKTYKSEIGSGCSHPCIALNCCCIPWKLRELDVRDCPVYGVLRGAIVPCARVRTLTIELQREGGLVISDV